VHRLLIAHGKRREVSIYGYGTESSYERWMKMATQLEIIVYGLACLDAQPGGYRVLFPDGFTTPMFDIPKHLAAVWVRERSELATAQWPWRSTGNDFTVSAPRKLTISGLLKTSNLDDSQLIGRLPNLRDADPQFTLSDAPEAILDLWIDRGVLSAHAFPAGMIVVKWVVDLDESVNTRLSFGDDAWIDLAPATKQVILANAGVSNNERPQRGNHFNLYRKLATNRSGELSVPDPAIRPQMLGVTLLDPTHEYARPRTPLIDCSPVFAH